MSSAKDPHEDKLRPHVYDGIQEYDNRLPNWWLWTFYLAVIFSAVYWFSWYNATVMETDDARIDREMARIEAIRLSQIGDITDAALWQMSRNANFTTAGKLIFQEKCVACHGTDLTGGIGVNLVDNVWLYGNRPVSIYAVVTHGSPNKMAGMQSWIGEIGPQGVSQVVAYLLSYHTEEEMAEATSINPPLTL